MASITRRRSRCRVHIRRERTVRSKRFTQLQDARAWARQVESAAWDPVCKRTEDGNPPNCSTHGNSDHCSQAAQRRAIDGERKSVFGMRWRHHRVCDIICSDLNAVPPSRRPALLQPRQRKRSVPSGHSTHTPSRNGMWVATVHPCARGIRASMHSKATRRLREKPSRSTLSGHPRPPAASHFGKAAVSRSRAFHKDRIMFDRHGHGTPRHTEEFWQAATACGTLAGGLSCEALGINE